MLASGKTLETTGLHFAAARSALLKQLLLCRRIKSSSPEQLGHPALQSRNCRR